MGIARSPDENRFFRTPPLLQCGNRLTEIAPEICGTVVLDDPLDAETQIQDINVLSEYLGKDIRLAWIISLETVQSHRAISAVPRAQWNRKHLQIGTRSNAGKTAVKEARSRPGGDDARNRGPVRKCSTPFINGRTKELFRDARAGERWMILIDTGIDQPDGHARARLHA